METTRDAIDSAAKLAGTALDQIFTSLENIKDDREFAIDSNRIELARLLAIAEQAHAEVSKILGSDYEYKIGESLGNLYSVTGSLQKLAEKYPAKKSA